MKPLLCSLLLSVVLGLAMAAALAAAPADGHVPLEPATDFFVFSGTMDRYNSGSFGSNGSVDWVHASGAQSTYTLGFGAYSVEDGRWSFAKIGGAYRWNGRTTIQAQASVGGGNTDGKGFGYQIYDGSLSYRMNARVYGRLGDQFFQIAGSRGHLLKPGMLLALARRLQADLTYAHSVTGDVGTQFFLGRMDVTSGAILFFGGCSVGYSSPQHLNLELGSAPVRQNFQEGFVGVGVPISNTVLSVSADFLSTNSSRRRSMTIGWKIPLGKRSAQKP